jgi:site-specific DNA-methyltransferase (adenine-specific)
MKALYSFDSKGICGEILNGDALAFLSGIKSGTADVVFLDPPFNLGKDYGNGKSQDRIPPQRYISWLISVIIESQRILMPGGALFIYHLPNIATQITSTLNLILEFRHWIAVSMKNTFVRGRHLYPAHYALLYYTKGAPSIFKRPKLSPKTCRKCGAYIKDYGGYKHVIDKKGINLSDIWDDMSPVRHVNRKTRGPNELPFEMVKRIVAISGSKGSLYVDPFVGGGNGVMAAIDAGMRFAVCDISPEYCRLVARRINRLNSDGR